MLNRRLLNYLLVILVASIYIEGCKSTSKTEKTQHESSPVNALIGETSPYLLQHAHNPVYWYPWSDEALDKAQGNDKLLVISIGYAACHWCHVMEKESFSDSTVAKLMNDNFVSIKIDREERPDIDQIYMDAALLMSGRGGWPLNVIALPSGKPIFAATYLPKADWLSLLNFYIKKYKEAPDQLVERGDLVTAGVQQIEVASLVERDQNFRPIQLQEHTKKILLDIDLSWGGRKGAPKFPVPVVYNFLLEQAYYSGDNSTLQAVITTLDNMGRGGIYDHVGGGFARYSTDRKWHIPHFEKMLYDNAQLLSLYASAFRKTKNVAYERIVKETISFIQREMTSPEGGFYSSLDADSDGEEGKFYVWTAEEIEQLLEGQAPIHKDYYGITTQGNWEDGKNVLMATSNIGRIKNTHQLSEDELAKALGDGNQQLLKARADRVRPGLDDKILTSWNALMISGLIEAYLTLEDEQYLIMALKAGDFLISNQIAAQGKVYRNYKDGKSTINGFLDDYAFTMNAMIKLYTATFDEKWLEQASLLKDYTVDHFWDSSSKMFFYTSSEDAPLIARKMDLTDNVIPSANAVMAHNLYLLGTYLYNEEDIALSMQMLNNVSEDVAQNPWSHTKWLSLQARFTYPQYEVAIVGPDFDAKRKEMLRQYHPNIILLGSSNEGTLKLLENKFVDGKTMIYVCQNKTCRLPVQDTNQALAQIN